MNLSDEMLTTPNAQYLHPDYLQPLPTTLDAKKSPLALLAQTCSSIGKDPSPNSKPIIPPFGKKEPEKAQEKSQTPENKRSGSSNSKTVKVHGPGQEDMLMRFLGLYLLMLAIYSLSNCDLILVVEPYACLYT